ncbi:MAG: hypothetical protein ACRDIB_09155, partial [Ardenticatenaceae bacterium]
MMSNSAGKAAARVWASDAGERPLTRGSAHVLWGIVVICLALFLLFFGFRLWNVLLFPHGIEHTEGLVLDWSRQIAAGALPYKLITPFPWNFSVYTPGYLTASALLLNLAPGSPWFGGRLLSALGALGLALLLILQMPRTRSRKNGHTSPPHPLTPSLPHLVTLSLAAALWIASPYVFRWATFFRPDMFALFWSALGVVLVGHALSRNRASLVVVGTLCFVASFYSKQSFVAAPLAAFLYLALARRAWLPHLLLPGISGGLLVAFVLWQKAGPPLLQDLIVANANAYSWEDFWRYERSFFLTVPILAVLSLWWVVAGHKAERQDMSRERPHVSLLGIYGLIALLATLAIGKAGAWENYFLESLWVFCALAGRASQGLHTAGGWRAVVAPLLILLQLGLFVPGFERRTPTAELTWLI